MDVDRVFDALASPARRQMLRHLSPGEMTTTELAARFAMSPPAVSRHLSVLENAGLVASRRDGQPVLYGLVRDTVIEALPGLAGDRPMRTRPEARPTKKQPDAV